MASKSPDISIIIPVYNAEKYLLRCVKSIFASLGEIKGEILLINNGSTDSSLEIMENLAKEQVRVVRVLHCNTRGASATRNLGAEDAKGEYIWFIDADDCIKKNAIPDLLEVARQNQADLVMLGANKISADGKSRYLAAVDAASKDYKHTFVRYGMGPWQVLIRRKWWQEHDFKFKKGIIHEDMELMSALILYTDKYTSVNQPLYDYYSNPESVLHKTQFDAHIFDIFPALEGLHQRFKDKRALKEYHADLEWFFIWNLLIDAACDFSRFPEGKVGFAHSRKMLREYYPNWRKNKFLKAKPLKTRLRVWLNYYKR